MSDIHHIGFLYDDSGDPIVGATVQAYVKDSTTTAGSSTTTNSDGKWSITTTSDNQLDIKITSGSSVRYRKFSDAIQVSEIEVGTFNIREAQTAQVYTIAPGSISADRTLTLPAATGDDTLASLGMAQTFSANQAFTGTVTVGTDGSGTDVILYSGTSGDNVTWDASEEVLQITGTDGATALDVLDGDVRVVDKLYLYDRGGEYLSSDGSTLTITGATTVSGGLTSTAASNTLGATSFNDAAITNVGDIALDSISADNTDINIAVTDNSATALTVKQGSDAYLIVDTANCSESVSIGTGISGTAITLGHGTSEVTVADNLTVSGNLTVTGTTTSVDSTTINVTNAFVFEGATADAHETTLAIIDPTADATINLPAMSAGTYYLPVMSAASTTAVASTPAELNLLDGSAKSTSSITICDADAFVVIDGTTTKQIPASDLTTYIGAGSMTSFQLEDDDGTEVAISNAKEVKFIGSGVTTNWTDTDNGTDGDPYDMTITVDAAQTGITSVYNASLKVGRDSGNLIDFATTDNKLIFRVECVNEVELVQNALSPVTSDGVALGTGSLMWSDAFLASGSVINFNNGDITLTHSACTLTMAGGTLAAPTILATDIKIGEDDQTKVDFACANIINLHANNIKAASIHNTSSKGDLRLYEACNYVSITTPALCANWVLTLPANDGCACQFLQTNGSGVTSWAAASGGGCVVCDCTPQLGGSLDAQTNTILNIGHAGNDIDAGGYNAVAGSNSAPSYAFTCDADMGFYYMASGRMGWSANGGVDRIVFDGCGAEILVRETANANVTNGITINQATADNLSFALKSSDVAHPMTAIDEADTYASFSKHSAATGGLLIKAFEESNPTSVVFQTNSVGDNSTKSTSARAHIEFQTRKSDGGTDLAYPGSDANLFAVGSSALMRFIFDNEGTAHADVGTATYDDYCDVELLRGLLATTCDQYKQNYTDKFGQELMYNQEWYEDNKILGRCSIHYETRDCGRVQQRAMINFTGLTMLHHSTIIQLADRLNDRIDGIETQLKALTEGK